MAAVGKRIGNGQQYRRRRNGTSPYVYGNVATQPEISPDYHEQSPKRPKKKVSSQVRRNRKLALHMNSAYVIFLAVAAVMALVVCVNYVELQSRITNRSKSVAAMQEELANLREENNAKYNAVMDSVNLDEIRDRAQNQLGMVYASPEQIVEYENPATDYVRQLEEIPDDGVLAQSSKRSR